MKWIVLTVLLTTDVSGYLLVPKAIRAEHPAAYLPGGGLLLFCAYYFGDKIK